MKQYWASLDGLRAIAVGIVMLAHAGSPFPRSGGVGVDIFFVLSGFLITGILSKEFNEYGCISRKCFYIRRFLRLTPCLVSCILVFVIFSFVSHGALRIDVVVIALSYTGNYARALWGYDLQSMEHCWSLAVEEQFYLLWPFVILFIERKVLTNLNKCLILLTLAFVLSLYRTAMVGTYDSGRIYFALDTHMDGLVLGASLSYFVGFLNESQKKYSLTRFYKIISWFILPVGIVGTMVLMYKITWLNPWMGRLGFTLVAMASSVAILDLVASPFSLFRKLLEHRFFVYLGKISYGLYLYHLPVYHFIWHVLSDMNPLYRAPIMVLLSVSIATLSYYLIEVRFLRLKGFFEHKLITD